MKKLKEIIREIINKLLKDDEIAYRQARIIIDKLGEIEY